MTRPTEIGILILVWTILPILLKQILRRCTRTSVSAKPGYVNVETRRFNETIFQRFRPVQEQKSLPTTTMRTKFHRKIEHENWFYDVGTFAAGTCSILGISTLSWNLLRVFFSSTTSSSNEQSNIMVPLVPGVTMPMTLSYVLPLSLSILMSAGFHEIGHAIACAREGIRIQSMGAFLMAPFLCGAYVRLPIEVQAMAPRRRLRVWSAGIWHNVLLCLVLMLILSTPFTWFLGFISSPLYSRSGRGAVVLEVPSLNSPLYGHVEMSDTFVGIGPHSVGSVDQWYESIREITASSTKASGFCVSSTWISQDSSCCDDGNTNVDDDVMCFRVSRNSRNDSMTCGSVRSLSKISNVLCNYDGENECSNNDEECVFPETISEYERVVWIDIRRGKHVSRSVYVGDLNALWSGIVLTDREYRFSIFSTFFTLLPMYLDRTLNLALGISATLAVLNAIPMYYLDGQHIFRSFLFMLMLRRRFRRRGHYTTLIYKWVMRSGTLLVGLNLLLSSLSFLKELFFVSFVKNDDVGTL